VHALIKVASDSPADVASTQECSPHGRGDKKVLQKALTKKVKPFRATLDKKAALSDKARALLSSAQAGGVSDKARKVLSGAKDYMKKDYAKFQHGRAVTKALDKRVKAAKPLLSEASLAPFSSARKMRSAVAREKLKAIGINPV
jgi:hypothetical protein